MAIPAASLVVPGGAGRTSRFRLDDPHLVLPDDAGGGGPVVRLAHALVALTAGEFGASVGRLTESGTAP